ncbi:MAG TPA: hypothetical protein VNH11_32245 [Pirellulales bacterium]|nr:hypothetical protein [Pirellulales bacterium]
MSRQRRESWCRFGLRMVLVHYRLSAPGARFVALVAFLAIAFRPADCHSRDPVADFDAAIQALVNLEEQRRKDTAEELERMRKGLAELGSRVHTMRQWTQLNFDLDKQGKIPRPKTVSKYLQGLEHRKETTAYALLQFRDQSRGAVKSGRAQNFFLDECGPAAFEMLYCRSLSRDQSRQGDADDFEREVLSGMTTNYKLDANIIRHIRYRRGLTGSKLTGRLNEKPLDLDHLNSVLRQAAFKNQVDRIASWRDRALAELEKGQPVSPDTAGKLMDAVQTLLDEIRAEKKKQAKFGFNAMRPYLQAERQMFAVYEGAARLIEANEAADVVVEEFKSGTICELLAYMQRNNLHFDAADDNGDVAYNTLYTLLSKFYLDLRALQQAVADSEQSYVGMAQRERQIADVKLGRSVSGARGDLWGKTLDGIQGAIEADNP